MLKNMNKTKRSNLITYAIVIVAFVVMQILSSTGSISSLLTGLLVPLCTYIILAVFSENLALAMQDLCVWEHFPVHFSQNV